VKTYHMMSASVENPPDCLMWLDALAAKYDGVCDFTRKEWDQLLGDCQVLCGQSVDHLNHIDHILSRQCATGRLVHSPKN
jgi:hypothetical protein